MTVPAVTAIVTCMTDEERPYIRAAVQSVLAQTVPCAVRVYVDERNAWIDGLLSEMRAAEIRRIPMQSVGKVRNLAVREARTGYVAFLDGDDVWFASKIAKQLKLAHREGARFVGTDYCLIDEAGRTFSFALCKYIAGTSTWLVDRLHMTDMGFSEVARNQEDGEWWRRTASAAIRPRLPEILVGVRVRAGSLSGPIPVQRYKHRLKRLSSAWGLRPVILGATWCCYQINRRDRYLWHPDWRQAKLPGSTGGKA